MLLAADMRPAFEKDAAQMLAEASRAGVAIEIVGSGSKSVDRPAEQHVAPAVDPHDEGHLAL